MSFNNCSIHRNALTGADHHDISGNNHGNGNFCFLPVTHDPCGIRTQTYEFLDGTGGRPLGARLKIFPQRDERKNHGGRLKIKIHHVLINQCCIIDSHTVADHVNCENTVNHRGARTERDERFHCRCPAVQHGKTAGEKRTVCREHRQ